ncbi:hypothetical protein Tco_0056607, partial [Tanacetum coccineum]
MSKGKILLKLAPIVNDIRPANVFHKTHSPSSRPFKSTTVQRTSFSNQKVYTVKVKEVSTVGGKWDTAVKSSADSSPNRLGSLRESPHRTLKNKGIIDSGCSRHMTGNKAYLADFQDFNGGPVAFGGSKGYITGKGKIKTKNAQSEGRTREMVDEDEFDEVILSTEDVVSTDKEGVSTEEQREGTEEKVESTAGQIKDTEDQTKEEIATQASQTPTSMIFGDDETIATLLLNMSQAK